MAGDYWVKLLTVKAEGDKLVVEVFQQSELNAKVLHIAARPESDPTFQPPIPILLHDAGEVWFLPPNIPQGDAILLSLAVGLVVGLLSAWAIWKQIRKGK